MMTYIRFLQSWKLLRSAVGKQLIDKPQQDELAPALKDDGTALELYIGFDFIGTFFQKFDRVFDFKFKIVIVRIGTEFNFLDHHLGGLGLNFFFFLSLEVRCLKSMILQTGGSDLAVISTRSMPRSKSPFHGMHGIINSGFYGFSGNLGEFVKIIAN